MADAKMIHHIHTDGRHCIIGPDDVWRHWGVEPDGPRDAGEWLCDRSHPTIDRRGLFGMPTLGAGTVTDIHATYAAEGRPATAEVPQLKDDPDGDKAWDDEDEEVEVTDRDDDMVMEIHMGGVVWHMPDGTTYRIDVASDDADYVLNDVIPHALVQFLQKNMKYAEVESGYQLGAAGIIPDLNRKLGILVARLWHCADEIGEGTDEVIDDMIGHLLLLRAKRRHD